jgi:hypothetical protein
MKQTYTLLVLLALILISSCSEPEGYSPNLRGTISGQILAFDAYNDSVSAKGFTITLTGERLTLQATTDSAGNYKIENVPYTNLSVTVYKKGFKNGQRKELNLSEEEATVDLQISRVPAFYVSKADFYLHNQTDLRATITLSEPAPAGKRYTLATFLSKTPDVSDTRYQVKSINGFTSDGKLNVTVLPSISVETLVNQHGFKSGDVAYIKVYTGAAQINGYWVDKTYFYGPGLNTDVAKTYTVTIP